MESRPLSLSTRQQDVLQSLKSRETERYPLSQWYLGALYAVSNRHNSDRFSQAAHSLRELVEKLPLVIIESDVQVDKYDITSGRHEIHSRLLKDREQYSGGWSGRKINPHLSNTLNKIWDYFKNVHRPSRREIIQISVAGVDPLARQLDKRIQESKQERIRQLWQDLEEIAHHRRSSKASKFEESLRSLEAIILDLLAPITAQDQNEIQFILSQTYRSNEDVDRVFDLMEKRGANHVFFFNHADGTSWISVLRERGYFSSPRNSEEMGDGQLYFPNWWPIVYLSRVAGKVPDEVVDIVLGLPQTDNPRVHNYILEIALQVPGKLSGRLLPKMLECAKLKVQIIPHRFAELLAHWAKESQYAAALVIAKRIIKFLPDPQFEYKRKRRGENAGDWTTLLEPSPQFSDWDYRLILEEGLNPLAERKPYDVARLLIDVVAEMIALKKYKDELEQDTDQDKSELWCRRLDSKSVMDKQPEVAVVAALTFACNRVFERYPELAIGLDSTLRNQRWKVFQRLRYHLYAMHPNEFTLPWIRGSILGYGHYGQRDYSHEFQRMIRCSSEHFTGELLTCTERISIFDAILNGPPEAQLRTWMGENFTMEIFDEYRRTFHRKQLRPFASMLFGSYASYYSELEEDDKATVSDEDYGPVGEAIAGRVCLLSPQTAKELVELEDEEILAYINEWDSEYRDTENPLVEISIEGLAEAFTTVFRETVLTEPKRLQFWLKNKHRIERPIYATAMIKEMAELIRAENFSRLRESLEFSEWILTHSDKEASEGYEAGQKFRQNPKWNSSRLAVTDFIATCLSKDINLPHSAKGQLAKQLEMLCLEFDWRLDGDNSVFPEWNDQYTEAINNTRSRALRSLVDFGLWLRRIDQQADLSPVKNILEERFGPATEYPLSLPEQAMLGAHFGQLLVLDEAWVIANVENFFPRHTLPKWQAAFDSLVRHVGPYRSTFEVLRDDFRLAVQHLEDFKKSDDFGDSFAVILGHHLFIYYMWGLDQLKGEESLIDQFYKRTKDKPDVWEGLFRRIGSSLPKKYEDLQDNTRDRLESFFEWRLKNGRKTELKEFEFWLGENCLAPEWRLNMFSRILDFAHPDGWEIYGESRTLHKMLDKHPKQVVECFAKLTDRLRNDTYHISTEIATEIIGVGLQSVDEDVRENALRAHDNLLKLGRSELLNLGPD